jgi:hypothetical protein
LQALNRRNGGENMGESVTLGNLLYFIKAKNEEFKKGMTEVEDKFESVNKKAADNSKKMKTWGLAITGISTGVLTVLQLMTKSTAEGVEKLEKYSIQTGMSTQQLQKWGYAAKLNKASLDQLAQGLVFLARSMRSADLESEAAKQAFKQLKIEFDDGKGGFRDMGDILDDIRDRFSKMANGAEKTALATKLFGRGAADLVPVLSLSREQLDELSQEAERLGIILTTDNIAQFAKYKDTLEATEEGLSGLKMQIAAAVIPAMQDMISIVKNIIMWFNQLPEPIKKGIPQLALMAATIGMIVGPIMLVSCAWGKLKTLFLGMQIVNALRGIATGAITASGAVSILAASFSSFLIGGAIITGLIAIFGWYAKIREQARLAKVDISSISDLQELQNQKQFWNEELKRRQKGFETFKDTFPKMDPTARQKAYQPYNDAINEARRKQEEIAQREKDLLKEQGIGGENFGNQFNIIDYLNNLNQKLLAVDKTAKAFGDTTNVAASKADLLKNAIIELIDNGVGPEDARIQKLVAQYKTYSAQADEVAEAEKRLEEQKKNQANATELVAAAQEKLGELYGVVISDNERFAQELEKMAAADGVLPEAAAQLKNLAAAFRRVDEEAENRTPFESWQKGLDESTKDWDNWGQHVEDIART